MISGKQQIAQRKSQMASHVARSVQCLNRQIVLDQRRAIGQHMIRAKGGINTLIARQSLSRKALHDWAATGRGGTVCIGCRPGCSNEAWDQAGMIQMGMGQQNASDPLSGAKRGQNSRQVAVQIGAGVDHHDVPFAQKIGVCAAASQWRAVVGADQPDIGLDLDNRRDQGRIGLSMSGRHG